MSSSSSLVLPYQIVNAFVDTASGGLGNPAAVFILESPLTEDQMKTTGILMQQPMSCFVVPLPGGSDEEKSFKIWWWNATGSESSLCGHGSIATSVLLSSMYPSLKVITYHTTSAGICPSNVISPLYADINFPLHDTPVDVPEPNRSLLSCLLNAIPDSVEADFGAVAKGTLDVIVEWKNKERSLGSLDIATEELEPIETRGISLTSLPPPPSPTAAAEGVEQPDLFLRVFSPRHLIPHEDQVCGSAHSDVLPFYLSRLPAKPEGAEWVSHHSSKRGGRLGLVPLEGGRLSLRGRGEVGRKGEVEI
ncbi:hypothetical protein BDY24DRAFT_405021 [Mrakia frigida]|uniref:uncharacterized protein n=1 Tax=Mrakia frigida TaxID=29902 RepID=UPI003FCBFE13